jgi:hypothetical protein
MKNETKVNKEYLPTPPISFWESLQVVRNYLLLHKCEEIFSLAQLRCGTKPTLRDAFNEVDFYLEFVRLERDESQQT